MVAAEAWAPLALELLPKIEENDDDDGSDGNDEQLASSEAMTAAKTTGATLKRREGWNSDTRTPLLPHAKA